MPVTTPRVRAAGNAPARAMPSRRIFRGGSIDTTRTALVNIDWQVDFCGPGGYVDAMGYDLSFTRKGLGPTMEVLAAARALEMLVVHTREGHRPDLSDCPPNKLWRSKQMGAGIGDSGPFGRILVRGEPGWDIVPEVAPIAGNRADRRATS